MCCRIIAVLVLFFVAYVDNLPVTISYMLNLTVVVPKYCVVAVFVIVDVQTVPYICMIVIRPKGKKYLARPPCCHFTFYSAFPYYQLDVVLGISRSAICRLSTGQ